MVLGVAGCDPAYTYRLPNGNISVVYAHGRVVYLDTSSSYYQSKTGIGVGATIPYGKRKRIDGLLFRFERPPGSRPGEGDWYHATRGRNGIGTVLWVSRGVVKDVIINRGTVSLQ